MPVISKFDINLEGELGHGHCGSVYRATHEETRQEVAAKKIRLKGNKERIECVKRESEILKKIPAHVNIMAYFGSEINGTDLWIFTEYCPLRDMDEYGSENEISEDTKFDIMVQIATAIKHLHEQDDPIAHRDIKPENILLVMENGQLIAKLADFGVSRIADVTKTFSTFAGTKEYMAPELFGVYVSLNDEDSEKTYGLAVDIFSAGLLFADFLVAVRRKLQPPMVDERPIGLAMYRSRGRLDTPPVEYSKHDSWQSLVLKELVRRMISYEPSDRPSAGEVLTTLQAITKIIAGTRKIHVEVADLAPVSNAASLQLVDYKCTFQEDSQDSQVEDGPIFNIRSDGELKLYDIHKTVIGINDAADLSLDDMDPILSRTVDMTTSKPMQASIKFAVFSRGTISIDPKEVKLSETAKEVFQSADSVLAFNHEYTENFKQITDKCCANYVVGKLEVGAAFEWVIMCDKRSDSKFSAISRDIRLSLPNLQLKGSEEGILYHVLEILPASIRQKFSDEQLNPYQVRVTKYGGRKQAETFGEWKQNVMTNNVSLLPISRREDFQIKPMQQLSHFGHFRLPEQTNGSLMVEMPALVSHDKQAEESSKRRMQCKKSLIMKMGLEQFYKGHISIHDVMHIKTSNIELSWTNLPWLILEEILMLDHRARDALVNMSNKELDNASDQQSSIEDKLSALAKPYDPRKDDLHPLDVFLLIFESCNPMMQQLLAHKMFLCKLAMPFLTVQDDESIICSLWALKGIRIEWKKDKEVHETSYTTHPMHNVSFIRLGRPSISKSKVLNEVIYGKTHDMFCNFESPGGMSARHVANGGVEIAHYLPSGRAADAFSQELTFLNLRGDGLSFMQQTNMLASVSSAVVLLLDITYIHECLDVFSMLTKEKMVVFLTSPQEKSAYLKSDLKEYQKILSAAVDVENVITAFTTEQKMNTSEIKSKLQNRLRIILENSVSPDTIITKLDKIARKNENFKLDTTLMTGYEDGCQLFKQLFRKLPQQESLQNLLPLQGKEWHEWGKLQKQMFRTREGKKSSLRRAKEKIKVQMNHHRNAQKSMCDNLAPLMVTFIQYLKLLTLKPEIIHIFLHCFKCELEVATEHVQHGSQEDCVSASLGLELLMREIGQIYEAAKSTSSDDIRRSSSLRSSTVQFPTQTGTQTNTAQRSASSDMIEQSSTDQSKWSWLPMVAARMLTHGYPLEIMDGEASTVPLLWIKDVFHSLEKLIGDKKVFILSIVGIQSSGKSTLLNTMFGLELAVSAGRCTRGIFAYLLTAQKSEVLFDYLLVLDSEGLRAQENSDGKYTHDNELASFILGLADLTIINLKGENSSEIQDVLEISVQAFLRMKLADKHRKQRCIFVHQNVSAVAAKEKMAHDHKRLQSDLDRITTQAARSEHMIAANVQLFFRDVIDFNCETDVWYLPDLWNGEPPMAPISHAYAERVRDLKKSLSNKFHDIAFHVLSIHELVFRIEDLWHAILTDDFVFSFKNTTAMSAHIDLDRKCLELSCDLEYEISSAKAKHVNTIGSVNSILVLDEETEKATNQMVEEGANIFARIKDCLLSHFDTCKDGYIIHDLQQEKLSSLQHKANVVLTKSKSEIMSHSLEQSKFLTRIQRKPDHIEQFKCRASQFAETKSKHVPHNDILDEFEKLWTELIEPVPKSISIHDIRDQMELSLCTEAYNKNYSIEDVLVCIRDGEKETTCLVTPVKEELVTVDWFKVKPDVKHVDKEDMCTHVARCLNSLREEISTKIIAMCKNDREYIFLHCKDIMIQTFEALEEIQDKDNLDYFDFTKKVKIEFLAEVLNGAVTCFSANEEGPKQSAARVEIKSVLKCAILEDFHELGQRYVCDNIHIFDDVPMEVDFTNSDSIFLAYLSQGKTRPDVGDTDSKSLKKIVDSINKEIRSIVSEDSKLDSVHGKRLVQAILEAFETLHSTDDLPPCDWELKGKITVAILYSKITAFEAMNMRYDIKHNIRARHEPYKEHIKTLFIHRVMASDSYTKLADVFMFKVGHELFTEVCWLTTMEITKAILSQCHFSKEQLMIEMLTSLAEKGDFNAFMNYIKDANAFAMEYIEKMVDDYAFESLQYTKIAAEHLDSLVELIIYGIRKASVLTTEQGEGEIDPNISKEERWCNTFCEAVEEKLPNIHKTYFAMIEDLEIDISDFEELERLIGEYLTKFTSETKQKFKKMDAESAQWEGLTPSVFLFERLWGCTTLCSFCGEPCKKTRANHNEPHECLQHRPICFYSGEYKKTAEKRELMCTFAVANDYFFTCRNENCPEKKGNKDKIVKHPFRNYRQCLPNWYILPDYPGEASKYWQWFMWTYRVQLAEYFSMETLDLPSEWGNISQQEAVYSLFHGVMH